MTKRGDLSGEDKVIVACVALLTLLTIVALTCLVIAPQQTVSIIPVMAGTVIAISSLAARHPPMAVVTAPTTSVQPASSTSGAAPVVPDELPATSP